MMTTTVDFVADHRRRRLDRALVSLGVLTVWTAVDAFHDGPPLVGWAVFLLVVAWGPRP